MLARWVPRLTGVLVWLGLTLIVVGLGMWWRETRPAAVLAYQIASSPPSSPPEFLPVSDPALTAPPAPPRIFLSSISRAPTATPRATVRARATRTRAPTQAATTPTPPATPTPTGPPPATTPPTRIVVPRIGLDSSVVEMGWRTWTDANGASYSEWIVPSFAAGWHQNSSLPGHSGNVVLSGHHNIEGEVFRYIVDLEPGDQIVLYVDDQPYAYTVAEKTIVPEADQPYEVRLRNAQYIAQTPDSRLTLVTCFPYTTNTHRVIVIARPVESQEVVASGAN